MQRKKADWFWREKRDEVVRRKEEKRVKWKEKTEKIEDLRVRVRQKLRGERKMVNE